MKISIILCLVAVAAPAFAGRAFPVDSENFVVDLFSRVNSRIEWDPDNYLVDLSGRYALCKNSGFRRPFTAKEKSPEGMSIGGLTATYIGGASDADTVKAYIKEVMPSWLTEAVFLRQIKNAEKFGCSIQPNCRRNFVIACLFSPEYKIANIQNPTGEPPIAKAFTPEQYRLTEAILGRNWDRSHFLENLSGQETDCDMIGREGWGFHKAKTIANERRLVIEPLYGYAENRGATEPAMVEVLSRWKDTIPKFKLGYIGCSLIPNCKGPGRMYVVVSCILSM